MARARSIAFCTMSTLTSSVGAMFTAASLMISASGWLGTSITKQWLMRRAVRMPVSRATTAPISSSVCRLPFIRASARPARTSSTALAAESWLCAASTNSKPEMSRPPFLAASRSRHYGPTRTGFTMPSLAASTALSSETASQGWAHRRGHRAAACARLQSAGRTSHAAAQQPSRQRRAYVFLLALPFLTAHR